MGAGGERTKGLDTGKGLVRTFMYMNNTTTPNMGFHHLTSIFATTAGRLVVPMRSLVTKFLTVTAIFVVAGTTVLAPSATAAPGDINNGGELFHDGDNGVGHKHNVEPVVQDGKVLGVITFLEGVS